VAQHIRTHINGDIDMTMTDTDTKSSERQQQGSSPSSQSQSQRPQGGSFPTKRSQLVTDQGSTAIADSVVAKIAGLATREVAGVHTMGAGAARSFGAIKDKLPIGSEVSASRGVSVEVGERQAAVDLDIVVEYGAAIVDVADAIRHNVIGRVEAMTGLEVSEVNVTVDDVYLGDDSDDAEPRVQ
jgi:uncharacterized alkaline shock family protein YloU